MTYTVNRTQYPTGSNHAGQIVARCTQCGATFDVGAERAKHPLFRSLCSPECITAVQVWHVWWTSDGQRFLHATYRNHADALTRARGLRRHGFTTQIKEQSQ